MLGEMEAVDTALMALLQQQKTHPMAVLPILLSRIEQGQFNWLNPLREDSSVLQPNHSLLPSEVLRSCVIAANAYQHLTNSAQHATLGQRCAAAAEALLSQIFALPGKHSLGEVECAELGLPAPIAPILIMWLRTRGTIQKISNLSSRLAEQMSRHCWESGVVGHEWVAGILDRSIPTSIRSSALTWVISMMDANSRLVAMENIAVLWQCYLGTGGYAINRDKLANVVRLLKAYLKGARVGFTWKALRWVELHCLVQLVGVVAAVPTSFWRGSESDIVSLTLYCLDFVWLLISRYLTTGGSLPETVRHLMPQDDSFTSARPTSAGSGRPSSGGSRPTTAGSSGLSGRINSGNDDSERREIFSLVVSLATSAQLLTSMDIFSTHSENDCTPTIVLFLTHPLWRACADLPLQLISREVERVSLSTITLLFIDMALRQYYNNVALPSNPAERLARLRVSTNKKVVLESLDPSFVANCEGVVPLAVAIVDNVIACTPASGADSTVCNALGSVLQDLLLISALRVTCALSSNYVTLSPTAAIVTAQKILSNDAIHNLIATKIVTEWQGLLVVLTGALTAQFDSEDDKCKPGGRSLTLLTNSVVGCAQWLYWHFVVASDVMLGATTSLALYNSVISFEDFDEDAAKDVICNLCSVAARLSEASHELVNSKDPVESKPKNSQLTQRQLRSLTRSAEGIFQTMSLMFAVLDLDSESVLGTVAATMNDAIEWFSHLEIERLLVQGTSHQGPHVDPEVNDDITARRHIDVLRDCLVQFFTQQRLNIVVHGSFQLFIDQCFRLTKVGKESALHSPRLALEAAGLMLTAQHPNTLLSEGQHAELLAVLFDFIENHLATGNLDKVTEGNVLIAIRSVTNVMALEGKVRTTKEGWVSRQEDQLDTTGIRQVTTAVAHQRYLPLINSVFGSHSVPQKVRASCLLDLLPSIPFDVVPAPAVVGVWLKKIVVTESSSCGSDGRLVLNAADILLLKVTAAVKDSKRKDSKKSSRQDPWIQLGVILLSDTEGCLSPEWMGSIARLAQRSASGSSPSTAMQSVGNVINALVELSDACALSDQISNEAVRLRLLKQLFHSMGTNAEFAATFGNFLGDSFLQAGDDEQWRGAIRSFVSSELNAHPSCLKSFATCINGPLLSSVDGCEVAAGKNELLHLWEELRLQATTASETKHFNDLLQRLATEGPGWCFSCLCSTGKGTLLDTLEALLDGVAHLEETKLLEGPRNEQSATSKTLNSDGPSVEDDTEQLLLSRRFENRWDCQTIEQVGKVIGRAMTTMLHGFNVGTEVVARPTRGALPKQVRANNERREGGLGFVFVFLTNLRTLLTKPSYGTHQIVDITRATLKFMPTGATPTHNTVGSLVLRGLSLMGTGDDDNDSFPTDWSLRFAHELLRLFTGTTLSPMVIVGMEAERGLCPMLEILLSQAST